MRSRASMLTVAIMAVLAATTFGNTVIPSGDVSGTWTAAGSPYLIQGHITIPGGETLAIDPGVEVEFQAAHGLTVNGCLEAYGAEGDSIRFNGITSWGGISFYDAPDASHLEYCTITGCLGFFGAISCINSSPVISHCRISDSSGQFGGGVYLQDSDSEISHCEIQRNYNVYDGGGVYCTHSNPVIDHCIVSENVSSLSGGGIYVHSGSVPTITNSTIRGNHADHGGGVEFYGADGGTITDCVITANIADGRGGGVYIQSTSSSFAFSNTTISHCGSNEGWGGGVYLDSARNVSFTRCTLDSNRAWGVWGGAMYVNDCDSLLIDHCDIVDNRAGVDLDGIHINGGDVNLTLANSLFKGQDGRDLILEAYSSASVAYCDFDNDHPSGAIIGGPAGLETLVQTNANGDSCDVYFNIFLDPLFVDYENGDYHLTGDSPCIDAGDPISPYDTDDTVCDIGVFYYDQTVIGVDEQLDYPAAISLIGNYPNPFNPQTNVVFSLPRPEWAEISVIGLDGHYITALATRSFSAGSHTLTWDGRDAQGRAMPSGTYIVRLDTESGVEARKVMLLR